jgi:hypothetical protein
MSVFTLDGVVDEDDGFVDCCALLLLLLAAAVDVDVIFLAAAESWVDLCRVVLLLLFFLSVSHQKKKKTVCHLYRTNTRQRALARRHRLRRIDLNSYMIFV